MFIIQSTKTKKYLKLIFKTEKDHIWVNDLNIATVFTTVFAAQLYTRACSKTSRPSIKLVENNHIFSVIPLKK